MSVNLGRRVMLWSRPYPCWPSIWGGHDEWCNPSVCLTVWPLGTVIVFWRPTLRTRADGPCDDCKARARVDGCCEWCQSRPCHCELLAS